VQVKNGGPMHSIAPPTLALAVPMTVIYILRDVCWRHGVEL